MNLYLTKSGRLKRKDNTLSFDIYKSETDEEPQVSEAGDCVDCFEDQEIEKKIDFPIETIDAIYLFGEVDLNTRMLGFLSQSRVPLHVFNYYGSHVGTYLPHAEQVSGDVVIAQVEAYQNLKRKLGLAKSFISSSIHNILSNLQYYERRDGGLAEPIAEISLLYEGLERANSIESVMGIEGQVRRLYYAAWSKWVLNLPDTFTRVYHPPDNPFNCLLSFLNSLLYGVIVSELYRTALYPGISYLHSPQSRRYSLALDLSEAFKPVLVDRLLFRLFNRKEIGTKHFKDKSNGVLLTNEARKKVIESWDDQLRITIDYPPLKRSVSYRQLIRIDCYKLISSLIEGKDFVAFRIPY